MPNIFVRLAQFLLTINPKNRKGLFITIGVLAAAYGVWYTLPVEYKDDFERVVGTITFQYIPEGGNNGTNFESSSSPTGSSGNGN